MLYKFISIMKKIFYLIGLIVLIHSCTVKSSDYQVSESDSITFSDNFKPDSVEFKKSESLKKGVDKIYFGYEGCDYIIYFNKSLKSGRVVHDRQCHCRKQRR